MPVPTLIPPNKTIWTTMDDIDRVMDFEIAEGTEYGWGGKLVDLSFPPKWTLAGPGCFGLIDYLARRALASREGPRFPEDSFTDDDWMAAHEYLECPYADCGLGDNIIRLAFHKPDEIDPVEHVWGVARGVTFESCRQFGPHRRPYTDLSELATTCYAVGYFKA